MITISKQYFTILALLLVLVMALSGCGKGDSLAKVNGKTISKQEFEAYSKFKRINISDAAHKKATLENYLQREALASIIEQQGQLDQAMIQAELNEFRKEMLISRYFEKFLKDKVSDDAIRNFYVANEKDYQSRSVHVAHILIRTNANMGEAEDKVKLTTAQEAYSKVQAGEEFAEVAKDYSEDTVSGKKGGDIGWQREGAIDKAFSEKVFAMEVDAVSEPFKTKFGYHIVKVIEAAKVETRPLDAVKGDIRYKLRNQAKSAELERMLKLVEITNYSE